MWVKGEDFLCSSDLLVQVLVWVSLGCREEWVSDGGEVCDGRRWVSRWAAVSISCRVLVMYSRVV